MGQNNLIEKAMRILLLVCSAAELWKKATAPLIKKMINNHQAAVTQKMKVIFLTGKNNHLE